jgi:2-polyprenyl-3-methyl-5-hydroxy-6-metoxy-1,4-benzoquinol methylase
MINNDLEYIKMFESESHHWWHKILHLQCLCRVQDHFRSKNVQIADAGCGTGGLIYYLSKHGYSNISGIDISNKAIELCKSRGLVAQTKDILNIDQEYKPDSLDVIFCNDVIYFLSHEQQVDFLNKSYSLLKKDGVLVMNIPCLKIFKGIHDVAVGIKSRFTKSKIETLADQTKFKINRFRYWPFTLSPIIMIVRIFQSVQLKFNKSLKIVSDVSVPFDLLNSAIYWLVRAELVLFRDYPWGSSALVTLIKR